MIESKEDLSFTVKFGDKEMIFNPGASETIKRDSSPGALTGVMTLECEELSDSEISIKCEVDLRNGILKGKYENCTIEGEFDPDSVEWVHA